MPLSAIDVATLLTDKEENLKLEQIQTTHISILDLLGDPGNPLYTEPHSMAEHFVAMLVGTRSIGELPSRGCCRDSKAAGHVYKDEARQACQKILRCMDVRLLDGDLVVPTCLRMPTLIHPTRHFIQMYYNLDAQGHYASQFPSRGQGFQQLRGDIRASIVPRDFRALPTEVWEAVDAYFHREELETRAYQDRDEDQDMSTDTEVAVMVRWLQVNDPPQPRHHYRRLYTTRLCWLQPLNLQNNSTTTILMIRSSTLMQSSLT